MIQLWRCKLGKQVATLMKFHGLASGLLLTPHIAVLLQLQMLHLKPAMLLLMAKAAMSPSMTNKRHGLQLCLHAPIQSCMTELKHVHRIGASFGYHAVWMLGVVLQASHR